jgi:hypothetical protein
MLCRFRFVLEVLRANGETVHSEALTPDWEPAVESVRLVGLRAQGSWGETELRIEPLWHATAGEPFIDGFRVDSSRGGATWSQDFVAGRYFADPIRSVLAKLVADNTLLADEAVQLRLAAHKAPTESSTPSPRFDTSELVRACVVRERGFAETVAASRPLGDEAATDFEVVLPDDVLEDICQLARAAEERETGGILIGHICRDEPPRGIGVEVTAHIPARHTVGDTVKLTFTSETWTDVRAAVALRQADELFLGWWHSHPALAWCKACPIVRQRQCHLATGFLSPDDRAFHRAMFSSAFTVALVVTNSVSGISPKLFGWRGGVLESRGFRVRAVDATAHVTS